MQKMKLRLLWNSTNSIRNAQDKLDQSKKTRTEILEEALQEECVTGCDGQ